MIDSIAARLGYTKLGNGDYFHPETNRTITIIGEKVIVTEEIHCEKEAHIVHVLTCNAGKLEESRLSKFNGEWTFVPFEDMHEQIAVVILHAPTMHVDVPIKLQKITISEYEDFIIKKILEKNPNIQIDKCEIKTLSKESVTVILCSSLQEICPFEGKHIDEILTTKTTNPHQKIIISLLQEILGVYPQQSSDTSKHAEHHLAHPHDEYKSSDEAVPNTLTFQP